MISTSSTISHDELAEYVGRDARLILEVGANDGTDTERLLATYPHATVHCFECDPRAIGAWPCVVRDGGRARLWPLAVSDVAGVAEFHQSGGLVQSGRPWDKSGSLCRPTGHLARSPEITFADRIEVSCLTLDAWADGRVPASGIDLLWIDVQGAELRVFRGGEDTIKRTRVIKAECHAGQPLYDGAPGEDEMIAYLDARGFWCVGRWGDDLLFVRRANA